LGEYKKAMKDLFDVLGIGFREDSYTTLLANIFEEPQGQEWARKYFAESRRTPLQIANGPVKTRLRPRVRRETGARFDVPDLVLTFGDPAELIWIIEAKIGASEGAAQLESYETEGVRTAILKSVGSTVAELGWH
jgi:hypothetical protein